MDLEELRGSPVGQLVAISGTDARTGDYSYFAFVPSPLPQEVSLQNHTWTEVSRAAEALGRLRQSCAQLPNPSLLIRPALAREAVDTSALEGTYGDLQDVLEARVTSERPKSAEVAEIRGYEKMALSAFDWIKDRPVTVGMLCDLQGILAADSRTPTRQPGHVRTHQVFIGQRDGTIYNARFVPPPPDDRLQGGLSEWAAWIQSPPADLPPVVQAAMAHYQFEALHPFGDGNGRLGRLLIVLHLLKQGVIPEPALTISPWLLRRREAYQSHLLRVSQTGDWNPWIEFFCEAITAQCLAHVRGTVKLLKWLNDARDRVNNRRWAGVIHRVVDGLVDWPVITMRFVADEYKVSGPTAKSVVDKLAELGILREVTGKPYRRRYIATGVVQIVDSL